MAVLDFFTVTSSGVGAVGVDYVDAGTDPDEDVVFAFVDFIPREPPGTVHWLPSLTPPRGVQLDTVRGRFSPEDGKLRTIVGNPTNEKQLVTATGTPFSLTYSGQTASGIAQTATPPTVQTALEALPNIAVGDVYVTGNVVNEKQTVTIGGGATGGTFPLTFSAQTASGISRNASASTVQALLQALSNIGPEGVSVTGATGGPWTVEFTGPLAGVNVAQLTSGSNALTPSGTVTIATTVTGSTGNPFTVNFIGTLAGTDAPQMTATNATISTLTVGTADLGVKLVANTTTLGLPELIYDVRFTVPDADPKKVDRVLNPFAFLAPTTAGATIDLASVTKLPPKTT